MKPSVLTPKPCTGKNCQRSYCVHSRAVLWIYWLHC